MEPIRNELHTNNITDEQAKRAVVTGGYFKIRPLNRGIALDLKGEFNSYNIKGISKVITKSKAFNKKVVELDMSAVQTIDMRAMALLFISLKTLKDNGIDSRITGLDGEKRKLAYELGMHYISEIA
jgi:anti-anti-sigma regulatory factor